MNQEYKLPKNKLKYSILGHNDSLCYGMLYVFNSDNNITINLTEFSIEIYYKQNFQL